MLNYSDTENFVKKLKEVVNKIPETNLNFLNAVSSYFETEAKKETPDFTGYLKKGWQSGKSIRKGSNYQNEVINTAKYSSFAEDKYPSNYKSFVPGYFSGGKFNYVRNYKGGILFLSRKRSTTSKKRKINKFNKNAFIVAVVRGNHFMNKKTIALLENNINSIYEPYFLELTKGIT